MMRKCLTYRAFVLYLKVRDELISINMAAHSRKIMQSFAKLSNNNEPPQMYYFGGFKSCVKLVRHFNKAALDVSLFLL